MATGAWAGACWMPGPWGLTGADSPTSAVSPERWCSSAQQMDTHQDNGAVVASLPAGCSVTARQPRTESVAWKAQSCLYHTARKQEVGKESSSSCFLLGISHNQAAERAAETGQEV